MRNRPLHTLTSMDVRGFWYCSTAAIQFSAWIRKILCRRIIFLFFDHLVLLMRGMFCLSSFRDCWWVRINRRYFKKKRILRQCRMRIWSRLQRPSLMCTMRNLDESNTIKRFGSSQSRKKKRQESSKSCEIRVTEKEENQHDLNRCSRLTILILWSYRAQHVFTSAQI